MDSYNFATSNFPEFVDLVRRVFNKTSGKTVETGIATSLFIRQPIEKGQGNSKSFTEVDTSTFAKLKREGQSVAKGSMGVGYSKTMNKKRVGIELDITQEMRDENRYSEIENIVLGISSHVVNRMELDATHRFTFANLSSYVDMDGETVDLTTGDGQPLLSTTHGLRQSSSTYNNIVTGAPIFGKAGVLVAEDIMTTEIRSNLNEKRVMNFNTIVTSDDSTTCAAVRQFLNSQSDNTQSNAGVTNVFKGKYDHLVLPYLATTATGAPDPSKAKRWFMVARGQGTNGFQGYLGIWEKPSLKTPESDPSLMDGHKDVWSFGTRGSYGLVSVAGRGVIGSLAV